MMTRIAVVLLLAGIVLSQKPVLKLCGKPQTDMRCKMMCKLTVDTVQPVKIYHGQTEVAACTDQNTCIVKEDAYTDSMISWDSHGNMTMIHFSINSLKITTDEGKWSCSHGHMSSEEQDLKIYSKPTTCDLMKVGDGENATLKCHVNCAYPQSEVQVQLFIDNKPTTEMPTMTDGDSKNCEHSEEKSLTYTWPVTFKSGSSYKCKCSMAAIEWTSSGMLKNKNEPSGFSITIIVAIAIVGVFLIIAIVIAIILIQRRRKASKGGARLATKEPEGEREEL